MEPPDSPDTETVRSFETADLGGFFDANQVPITTEQLERTPQSL